MSKPANKKAIGLFVLGAIALLVVALVVFGSGKIFKKTYPITFYFEGSVKGLNVGSAVVFRGVKVGSVTGVELLYDPKDLTSEIRVVAEFDPGSAVPVGKGAPVRQPSPRERMENFRKLVDRGLRAQLQVQSVLTGLLMINLDYMPGTPARLVAKNPDEMEIPTLPTAMEELAEKLEKLPFEEIFEKLNASVEGIEKVINSPEVQGGMKSLSLSAAEVEKLVKSIHAEIKPLSESIHGTLKDARTLIHDADTQMQRVSSRLDDVMKDTQKLMQNVNSQVEPLASRAEGTLEATQKLVSELDREVGPVASALKKTMEEARGAIGQARKTLQTVEGSYAEDSAFHYELTQALAGLSEASRSLHLLGEYLKQHPDSVLWGKGKPGGR